MWACALIAVAICAPFFRYVYWLGDEGVVLHGAERILRGEALYAEFFEFLPPGAFLIAATWMQLFGPELSSVRVLAVGVIAVIAALTYASARLASGNRSLAALLAIAWAVFSQGAWTTINHHWFATAASMASAVTLLSALASARGGAGFFAAGLFAGTAAMIVSTRGALLCLAILGVMLTLPGRRRLLPVLGGIAVFPAATLLYLVVTGTLAAAFVDVVLFPARHYSEIQVVVFGAFTAPHQAPAVAFFPLTFVLAGTTAVLGGGALWREPRVRASLALALVGLLGAFPRPDLPHINFTVPLACPLFALVATHLLRRLGRRLQIAASALALAVSGVGIGYAIHQEVVPLVAGPLREVATTRGVFVAPQSPWIDAVAALVAQLERTPRDDAFFFYPYSPMLPYLTGRRHMAALDVMMPGYTTVEQYRDVCVRVVRDAQWVVIDRSWSDPRVLRVSFPGMRDPDPPEKRGLEAALRLAFDNVVHAWRGFELRRRAHSPSEAVCSSI